MTIVGCSFDRGTGLGNRLFPWARAAVYSSLHKLPMLAPWWPRPAWRQLYLGGADWRNYHRQLLLLDNFSSRGKYLVGYRWFKEWVFTNKVMEPSNLSHAPSRIPDVQRSDALIVFRGQKLMFADIVKYRRIIENELTSIAKAKWSTAAASLPSPLVGINVRCARDFIRAQTAEDYFSKGCLLTPISWFVRALRETRRIANWHVPALLVSDGSDEELYPILNEGNVKRLRPGCAIADLLALSRCSVLIGSGGSSFSAWASFLGQMPTYTIGGQSLQWFGLELDGGICIQDGEPEDMSELLRSQILSACSQI